MQKRIMIQKQKKSTTQPAPIDTRTPSGKVLPY